MDEETQPGPWRWYAGETMGGSYGLACAPTREAAIAAASARLGPHDQYHLVEARYSADDEATATGGYAPLAVFRDVRAAEWITIPAPAQD